MKLLWALLLVLCLLVAGVTVFVWSGVYNVSAKVPHLGITHWVLEKARERSIAFHSKSITPPSLDNPKLVDSGFREYHEMCRLCHGAPGYPRSDIAEGLYPPPPKLTTDEVIKEINEAELYWVIKNGIKMTGMAAFGPTHSEDELWAIVAFVKHLPNLKADEYDSMVKKIRKHGEEGADHYHNHKK
jgi:mono/diheme cytochrome c family protein